VTPEERFVHFVALFLQWEHHSDSHKRDILVEAYKVSSIAAGAGEPVMVHAFEFTRYKTTGAGRPGWLDR
jgi:hypothetical protein